MTNLELEQRIHVLIKSERKITSEIVTLIREADFRRLYLERGHQTLFDWFQKTYSYSHSSAYRRIQASRVQKDVPEVAAKIESGEVSLATLSQLDSAFRNSERHGKRIPVKQKRSVFTQVKDLSANETQKVLAETFPDSVVHKESLRHVGHEDSRLTFVISNEDRAALERVKDLISHSHPNATWADVVGYALRFVVKAKDKTSTRPAAATAAHGAKSKAAIRREVRARGCEFQDPVTKRVCRSRYRVEVDHIIPRAKGGGDELENLRCLCRNHNLLMAERHFGKKKMKRYWPTS